MKYTKLLIIGIILGFFGVSLYTHQQQTTYTKDVPQVVATSSQETNEAEPVVITFVGDMMFDRYIRAQAEENDYNEILFDVKNQLQGADFVVGNLEGPITNFSSVSTYDSADPNHYRFTFAPEVAELLASHNIRLASIGNNHIENFGADGIDQTTNFLQEAGVQFIGHPFDPARMSTTTKINGQRFGFTSYNYADNSTAQDTVDEITRLKTEKPTPEWVIVYAHWGQEYNKQPSVQQRELARQFIDAGADIIIGTHPHVIQSKEMYKGAPIYYSLGNFVFDQYFSPDVRCGLMLTATFLPNGTLQTKESFAELMKDGRTQQSSCRDRVQNLH